MSGSKSLTETHGNPTNLFRYHIVAAEEFLAKSSKGHTEDQNRWSDSSYPLGGVPFDLYVYVPRLQSAIDWAFDIYPSARDWPSLDELARRGLDVIRESEESLLIYGAAWRLLQIDRRGEDVLGVRSNRELLIDLAVKQLAEIEGSPIHEAAELSSTDERWHAACILWLRLWLLDAMGFDPSWGDFGPRSQVSMWSRQPMSRWAAAICVEQAFAIGYLHRDAWWKRNHEAAAIRAYEYSAAQRERSVKGADAASRKAHERKQRFFSLALASIPRWITKSEKRQIALLKSIAADFDTTRGGQLFCYGNKALSDEWFCDALAELRASGELDRAMGG